MTPARLLFPCLTLALLSGCATPDSSPAARSANIPDRPEQLAFDELKYEPPDPADYRVQLKSGPVAYVAEDRELPLVNLSILLRVGNYLDPVGEEGLAIFTTAQLTRGGTASRTAEELEERLAFLAANLMSVASDTEGTLTLNLLSKDLDEGLSIVREVLTAPRFQEDKLELGQQRMLQAIKQRNDDSSSIEGREQDFLSFGESFWANRYETEASIDSITRDDLLAFHQRWVHPRNFVVAASGDFDRTEMIGKLETLFADWPYPGETPPAIATNIQFAAPGAYLVDKDVNQGRVSILLPGVMRDDPDYFAIMVMNRILGGGGFTSRIVNRVRSDEGLAYSAGSSFQGGVYYPLPFTAGFQSKSRTVAYATSIVLEEMKRIATEPVSDEELETAKRSMIDTFPRAFASKSAVVARFAGDEFTGRFPGDFDFYRTYRSKVDAVTIKDVQRVAAEHLDTRAVRVLVVGNKADILKGDETHPVTLKELAGGRIVDVPLRDPLTMKPTLEPAAADPAQ